MNNKVFVQKHKKPIIITAIISILIVATTVGAILINRKNPAKLTDYVAIADDNPFVIDTGYKKPEINLDGKLDDTQWASLKELVFGDAVSASVKAFYGESGIYIGAKVTDKDLWGSSNNIYDNSSFEIYLDTKGEGGAIPGSNHLQIFIDVNERILVRRGNSGKWIDTDLIKNYAVQVDGTIGDKTADTGYSVELFIPYSQMGGEPQADYGMAFGLVECKAGTRDAWTGISGVNPQSPDTYYKFYRDSNSIEAIRKVNKSEITLDGVGNESQWNGKASYVFGDGGRGAVKSFFGKAGLYLYFDMKDNNVFAQGTAPYLNDSVEIYLDTLKDGGTKPRKDDIQVRADVSGNIALLRGDGTTWVEALNMAFSGIKIDGTFNGSAKGYAIELFIPWSDMGMAVAPGSMAINFGSVDYNGQKDAAGKRIIAWSGTGKDVQIPDTYINIDGNGVQGAAVVSPASEIKLDGVMDDKNWEGTPTFTYNGGKVSVHWIWTDKGCYAGFDVKDTSIHTDGAKPFENSSVELYLDYKKDGGKPKSDDRTILIDAAGNMLFRKGVKDAFEDYGTRAILSGVKKTSSGYSVEVFIPWTEFGTSGKPAVMGVAFGQVTRPSTAKETVWTNDGLCTNPQIPGNYTRFTPARIGEEAVKPAITLDGNDNDSIWSNRTVFTYGANNSVKVRHYMDDKGINLFFQISDLDVWAKSSKPWENDGIEIYIDTLKDGGLKPKTDDYQIRIDAANTITCLRGSGIDPAWNNCPNIAQTAIQVNGTLNDTQADTGFNVEVFIPWSALGLSAKPESMGINFGAPRNQKNVFDGWSGTLTDPQKPSDYYTINNNSITK